MNTRVAASAASLSRLIHPDEALLVLGSLNANPQDRYLGRSKIRPVQVIDRYGIKAVPSLNDLGQLGVSSLAWHPSEPSNLYLTTGDDLIKVELSKRRIVHLEVSGLRDVHEITMLRNTLWLANTGADEAVAFDVARGRVSRRINLAGRDHAPGAEADAARPELGEEVRILDRFHCNQVFEGFDGELYVLVHHVSGKQLVRRVAQKLIKSQGDGGVIGLTNGSALPLGLKGPHTVRKVEGDYWVFDSGNATLNVYDPSWTLKRKLSTEGWGRGASTSERQPAFYAGVSETRKRYARLIRSGGRTPNLVQVFSTETGAPIGRIVLSKIEQVNNVYTVSGSIARALVDLRESFQADAFNGFSEGS
jgi:hypothetical protein